MVAKRVWTTDDSSAKSSTIARDAARAIEALGRQASVFQGDLTKGADVARVIDGAVAPFGDVVELQHLVKTEPRHPGLFDLFLEVRHAAARIVDRTSLADVVVRNRTLLARRPRTVSRDLGAP